MGWLTYWIVLFTLYLSKSTAYKYTLLTPKNVRLGSPIVSHFTLHECPDSEPSCNATLRSSLITRRPYDQSLYVNGEAHQETVISESSAHVTSGVTTQLIVQIPDGTLPQTYNLTVEDTAGGLYHHAPINIKPTPSVIVIQTDKPVYKRKQTINIRVLILDEDLRPLNIPFNATIKNSNNTQVKRWVDLMPTTGLYDLSVEVYRNAPYGTWKITVFTELGEETLSVEVKKYVLPRFGLNVDHPSFITAGDGTYSISVTSSYTHGKPVSGVLKVDAYMAMDFGVTILPESHFTLRMDNYDGTAVIPVDKPFEVPFPENMYVVLNVTLYEPLSGETLNYMGYIQLATTEYTLEWMELSSEHFRPGVPFQAYFKVTSLSSDNLPLNTTVNVTLTLNYDDSTSTSMLVEVDENGIAQATIDTDKSSDKVLGLEANLVGFPSVKTFNERWVGLFPVKYSINYLKLMVSSKLSPTYQAGGVIRFDVFSSDPSITYQYMVIANDKVLQYGDVQLEENHTLDVELSPLHAPQTTVLIYAKMNYELLSDSLTFNVYGVLGNKVTAEFSNTTVTPGSNVSLSVNTSVGSLIGLSSIDSKVLLIGKSNWVTKDKMVTMKESFTERKYTCTAITTETMIAPGIPRDFHYAVDGTRNTGFIFALAGYTVKTNLDLEECLEERAFMFPFREPEAPVRIRKYFPETWLWDLIPAAEQTTTLSLTVPDSITSWETQAISIHPEYGLGIVKLDKLRVMKDVFLELMLPYSVILGEELELPVIVSNYLPSSTTCNITVHKNVQLQVIQDSSSAVSHHTIMLSAESSDRTVFLIRPLDLGNVLIHAELRCDNDRADAVERPLLVKPGGIAKEFCYNEFISLSGESSFATKKNLQLPNTTIPGSAHIRTSTSGNLLGSSLDSLDHLVRLPFGCGEQNMVLMAPSIYTRKYLETLDQPDLQLEEKTTEVMRNGYLSQLSFYRHDGGFSAFGNNDGNGSLWLTAFVVKCFRQAQPYINDTVDQNVMDEARRFIARAIRTRDGAFIDRGVVIHPEMQGGSTENRYLETAYVTIAFLEDDPDFEEIKEYLNTYKTIEYLEGSYNLIDRKPYWMALVTYALVLAESPQADRFFSRLQTLARTERNMIYWTDHDAGIGEEYLDSLFNSPHLGSSTVEMTSYALLSYLRLGRLHDAMKIAQFLIRMRNVDGGFRSTQDTVLGLQALAAFAVASKKDVYNINVSYESRSQTINQVVNDDNFLTTNIEEFKNSTDVNEVLVSASGSGSALLSVCADYAVRSERNVNNVDLTVTTDLHPQANMTYVTACARSLEEITGMSVISVSMPSGYRPIRSRIVSTPTRSKLEETDELDNTVHVYYDAFSTKHFTCVTVLIEPELYVRDLQQAFVKAYDYYKSEGGDVKPYRPLLHQTKGVEYTVIEKTTPAIAAVSGDNTNDSIPTVRVTTRTYLLYTVLLCLYIVFF